MSVNTYKAFVYISEFPTASSHHWVLWRPAAQVDGAAEIAVYHPRGEPPVRCSRNFRLQFQVEIRESAESDSLHTKHMKLKNKHRICFFYVSMHCVETVT